MNNKYNIELSSQQIKYRDILSKEFLEMEIWAISDIDPNRNETHFTLDSMTNALPGFKNKPIVGFFNNGDFVEHNGKMEFDPELQKTFWNTEKGERVLGVIRESDNVEIVEKNGLHWIKLSCVLFVQYCYRQIKKLLKDKSKKVSVEITVHDSYIRDDGVEEILNFTLNGITILGTSRGKPVIEAIPDAHATILEQLDEDVLEEQKKMLSFAYIKMDGLNDINSEGKEDVIAMENNIEEIIEETPAVVEEPVVTDAESEGAITETEPVIEMAAAEETAEVVEQETETVDNEVITEPVEEPVIEPQEDYEEKFNSLTEEYNKLSVLCDQYSVRISECEEELKKYADYNDIRDRMIKAEHTVWEHFCDKMKNLAKAKMDCEDIADEDRKQIEMKASNGEYADEEALDKDIAYAAYKNRQSKTHTKWEHFEVELHTETSVESKSMTRQERLAQKAGKK